MHANRNEKAVKRVERGMMKANRIRNLFAVFAIILTTFMITTVFSLGINYEVNAGPHRRDNRRCVPCDADESAETADSGLGIRQNGGDTVHGRLCCREE